MLQLGNYLADAYRGILYCDAVFFVEDLDSRSNELRTVVRQNRIWNAEPRNNVFPDKALDITRSSVDQWNSFNPFGEEVGSSVHVLEPSKSLRHFANDVKGPNRERPWTSDHLKWEGRLVDEGCLLLAPNALLDSPPTV